MSRRRLLEFALALLVGLLLLAVLFVRPTSRRTVPPPIALFTRVEGVPPDFASGAYAARAVRSPDGSRVAVLYPVEFELPSDLYIVEGPGRGTRFVLADSLRDRFQPKGVGWVDDARLWVTLGWLYGTVSPGGDLFLVDPVTGQAAPLWVTPDSGMTQAVAVGAGGAAGPGGLEVRLRRFNETMSPEEDSTVTVPAEAVAAARRTLAEGERLAGRPR